MTAAVLEAVVVASSDDRPAWLAARRKGVAASDVAKIGGKAGAATLRRVLAEKREDIAEWAGNASTAHGNAGEPEILAWVAAASAAGRFGSGPLRVSHELYSRVDEPRHLATPDGISEDFDFYAEIVEVKTTVDERSAPPAEHVRQMQWQMHVTGAVRCLYVWEQHKGFRPVDLEPRWVWVKRDQAAIDELVVKAARLLLLMDGETPDVDPVIDELISRRVVAAAALEVAKDELAAIDAEIRDYIGDADALSVLGTVGDLSWSRSVARRFSSTALRDADPDTYEKYLRESPTSRLVITPVKKETAA